MIFYFTIFYSLILKSVREIDGVFLSEDSKNWVIVRYEGIKIMTNFEFENIIYSKHITTQKELIGICRILNDSRIPGFDSQTLISLILEKYWSESLIYE